MDVSRSMIDSLEFRESVEPNLRGVFVKVSGVKARFANVEVDVGLEIVVNS